MLLCGTEGTYVGAFTVPRHSTRHIVLTSCASESVQRFCCDQVRQVCHIGLMRRAVAVIDHTCVTHVRPAYESSVGHAARGASLLTICD